MTEISELLANFQNTVDRRVAAENELRQLTAGPHEYESRLRSRLNELLSTRDTEIETATEAFEQLHAQLTAEFDRKLSAAEAEHRETVESTEDNAWNERRQIEAKRNESDWVVTSVMDDSVDDSPARTFERFKTLLEKSREDQVAEWENLNAAIEQEIAARNWNGAAAAELPSPPRNRDMAAEYFQDAVTSARKQLKKLHSQILPRLVNGFRSLGLFVVIAGILAGLVFTLGDPRLFGLSEGPSQVPWMICSLIVGAFASLLLTLVVYTLTTMRQSEMMQQLVDARQETQWAHQHWLRFAKEQLIQQQKEFESQHKKVQRDRQQALARYEQAHEQKLAEIEADKKERLRIEQRRYAEEHASLSAAKREQLTTLEQSHQQRISQLNLQATDEIGRVQTELERISAERRRSQHDCWVSLKTAWDEGWRQFETELNKARERDQRAFASWRQLAKGDWKPATEIPSAIRLGDFFIDLTAWEDAVSRDVRLAPRITQQTFPFQLAFPEGTAVLFRSPNPAARTVAIQGLQTLMLRLLTLLPPGKLRFTIIDPVGLGESFGGFMHLTDYDELLVTNRIWTEANQIEARLADLTEHMENVLQKYLRNEFQSIEEYNRSAGEVAEPYHVLVISDFPAKFSEIAARRLISIVNSGPRCGVYTLLNFDPGKQLPNNFSLQDIEPRMARLDWEEGSFYASDSALPEWPVIIDPPPPPDQFTSIVKMVGNASKDARRVEVSFHRISPKPDEIWSRDSRSELVAPLGRAGATKLQQLRLGKGTSQHMLVAGKTGSGKSTFLHILITNLSLYYSPDEVNFFLIDFKKGVEFKDYATHQLPHARVIAVESDREFGVSALQKLGDILQERGELFRREGVQDIAGYRNATGRPLPRILLVVDEFQEFFVEDDKLSQNAALLLDRLVRQGRAFGIHVVLGSQTLGGAYSLARSTLGQVAVRVALQCSEADAHLILSEDNTAARLLTRPGEAIYNDANGMLEGNHPFQIAWLRDTEREAALDKMHQRLTQTTMPLEPVIVFEGNIPSDLTHNSRVTRLIDEYPERTEPLAAPTFWLGDAVEIAPATAVTLHRQSGSNLLIVGQDAEAALGVMGAALITLGASLAPDQEVNSLFVLDGSHAGSEEARQWEKLVDVLPADARLIRAEETETFLEAMSAELQRRETENDTHAPPIVLLIYHIARFRDLRKAEDDFGLGSFGGGMDKPASPGKQFADLLARGPAVGMHCIVWCDSSNNVDRWFSRQSLREMELRVAFQMNASDSSNLIDSPAASRLGTHRALLYREETGTVEKFRPYGLPPAAWLETARRRLRGETIVPENESEQTDTATEVEAANDEPDIPDLEEFSIQ